MDTFPSGERLRFARGLKRLSNTELADNLLVSVNNLKKWFGARKKIPNEHQASTAVYFGVEKWVFSDDIPEWENDDLEFLQSVFTKIINNPEEQEKYRQQLLSSLDSASTEDPLDGLKKLRELAEVTENENKIIREAIAEQTKAILLDPDDAQLYYKRARARMEIAEHDEVLQDLNKAIVLDPENALCYYLRWILKVYQGEVESNQADLEKAIQKKPGFDWDTFWSISNNPTALGIRAMAYIHNSDFDRAYNDFVKACSISKEFSASEFASIELKGQLTRHFLNANTIDELSTAVKLCSDMSDPYFRRGKLYFENRQFENAVSDLTLAIEKNSWFWGSLFEEYVNIYFIRAKAFAKSGKVKEAILDLEIYLKHKPNDTEAMDILRRLKTDGIEKSYFDIK